MKGCSLNCIAVYLCSIALSATSPVAQSQEFRNQWKDPFPSGTYTLVFIPDSLTIDMALRLVARANSSLQSTQKQREAALGSVRQANLRPNPELELEAEDVSGDLTGFRQSEMAVQVSQEIELWGQRKARRNVALSDMEAVSWETRVNDFDIYAETKLRFYALLHAQKKLELAEEAAQLASDVAEATRIRVEKGAALSSEQSLSELSFDRARMEAELAKTELENARRNLATLWRGEGNNLKVVGSDPPTLTLPDLTVLESYSKESREVVRWRLEETSINAQLNLEKATRPPSPTLSGGYKRSEAEEINTFLVGLAIPLPLFNRNQGNISSLRAQLEAARFAQEQALINTEAELQTIHRRLNQLISNRVSLDTLILPKAEEAYLSLKRAYELGGIPYSTLLEGERSLIDLRFELNDLDLAIKQEIIALERLLGISLKSIIINQRRK
jgi:cobalt-zinc-cadmium efflux system outer membrane protein